MISNMGGPDSLDAVEPYLYNIFSDPDIIDIPLPGFLRKPLVRWISKKRGPESRHIYEQIGGQTPLTEITEHQAALLQNMLNENGADRFDVFSAMRYWHPFIEDQWEKITGGNFDKVIILSLYPFYSTATGGSLINLINRLNAGKIVADEDLLLIDRFGNHPRFIQAMADDINAALSEDKDCRDVLFSAHSIPMKRIRQGDPYRDEVEAAAEALRKELPERINFHLSYQSKVGPVQWLSPATDETIKALAEQGVKKLIVYPLGFVADNSETIYEIGILYKNLAHENGITDYKFIKALNTNETFIFGLKEIIHDNFSRMVRTQKAGFAE